MPVFYLSERDIFSYGSIITNIFYNVNRIYINRSYLQICLNVIGQYASDSANGLRIGIFCGRIVDIL